jgi:thiamine monophosphate synthase
VSDRQARRITKVATFAIGGIDLYLSRNPRIMDALQYAVDFIASYRASLVEDMAA